MWFIGCLLIGSDAYYTHKDKRFRTGDAKDITKNEAFILSDETTHNLYARSFKEKSAIYFGEQPSFEAILARIQQYASRL